MPGRPKPPPADMTAKLAEQVREENRKLVEAQLADEARRVLLPSPGRKGTSKKTTPKKKKK